MSLHRRDFLRSLGVAGLGAVVAPRAVGTWLPQQPPRRAAARVEGPGVATTAYMDALWDESVGLIRSPEGLPHPVRESSWYALGLLARGDDGDVERATRAIETVVSKQYDSPGAVFHGSFPRFPTDPPLPPANATPFIEFDPNWRQFIGTALAMAVIRYGKQLGSARAGAEQAVTRAAEGEPVDRVQPDYSNIAIMHAWLLAHTGDTAAGEALAKAVAARYREAGALDEYNSPTYDGVALYALGLWREEPPSRVFRSLGEELHDGLWRNIASTYHAGLRNVCGPYARGYGMDLSTYAGQVGLWIWSIVGQDRAPFPDLEQPFDHTSDVCFGPLVDLFEPAIPAAARRSLRSFGGPHDVRVGVPGTWEATSVLEKDVMVGGWTGAPVRVGGQQIHPATVHWADGSIRVRSDSPIDAEARKRRLDLTIKGPASATVTIAVPGLDPAAVTETHWTLPGLEVDVQCDALPTSGPTPMEEGVQVVYPPSTLRLDVTPT